MSDYEKFEYRPLDTYEIQWTSGHVEQIHAHQVILPKDGVMMLAGLGMHFGPEQPSRQFVTIHGEIDGKWKLILRAPEDDIRSIRLVTTPESIPLGGAS